MDLKYAVKIFSLFVVLGTISCQTNNDEKKIEVELSSGILTENMDTSVNPGDDFTSYVNGTWMKNTEIPSYKSSYGI
jgi:putative endopeptidase